jgi:hypothetical protein
MSKSWLGGRKSGVSRQVNLVGTSDDGRCRDEGRVESGQEGWLLL